ncbi:MAG: hypothetical protein FWG80_01005 [Alphaproteobacteria bacterium]|nr:hypothetical protein [Alphaproteobacteria bacterium]
MSEIVSQILKELDTLEESASKLRSVAAGAGKQTDLEVAILNQQMAELRDKNARATEFVNDAMEIIKKLKKTED